MSFELGGEDPFFVDVETTGDEFDHPAWPLQFLTRPDGSVTFAAVTQDSDAEHKASAAVIAATPRGAHLGDPTFGVTSPLFDQAPVNADRLAQEIAHSDPRLTVTAREAAELTNAARRVVTVAVGRADAPEDR
jgi:hypothetical protein